MSSTYSFCDLVKISATSYRACLSHALITDTEEVMGLLLGNVIQEGKTNIIEIYTTVSLSRNCKEKDRVEFDEVQIANASEYAEKIGKKNGIEVRVVGWYHSHPKITVPPSHVDLNTQFSQQYQGQFIGLIFSVFNNNLQSNINTIQVIAFQSRMGSSGEMLTNYVNISVEDEVSLFKNKINNLNSVSLCKSTEVFSQMLNNLLLEEEEESLKQKSFFDKSSLKIKDSNNKENSDFSYNELILSANRQAMLVKIIELIAIPITTGIVNEKSSLLKLIEFYDIMNLSLETKLDFIKKSKIEQKTEDK